MVAPNNGKLARPKTSLPPAAGGSINGMRVLMALLLLVIAVGAITGVVVALSSGLWQVAMIVALVAGAFFCRVGC